MRTVLLIHSPLLGPSSWRPCADLLAAAGHRVLVPDLRFAVSPPAGWWDRAATAAASVAAADPLAAAAAADPAGVGAAADPADSATLADPPAGVGAADGVVVVGHSGAGVLLPLVAERVGRVAAVVFVDAVLAASGATEASDRIRSFVAGLPAEDGLLPPWSRWWGEAAMAELVPDAAERERLAADQPRLSPEFWDEPVPVPAGLPAERAGYLRLSPAYEAEAEEAARRGWPVRTVEGTHLDPFVRPAEVCAAILDVVRATSDAASPGTGLDGESHPSEPGIAGPPGAEEDRRGRRRRLPVEHMTDPDPAAHPDRRARVGRLGLSVALAGAVFWFISTKVDVRSAWDGARRRALALREENSWCRT